MFTRLQNLSNRAVLLILFLLFAGGSLWSLLINLTKPNGDFADWGEGWLQNFSTEMFGAFITFLLLTLVVSNRQEKERLIRQLGSQVNEAALQAAEELEAHGWLRDGSMQNANLGGANLQRAIMRDVNLQGAYLKGAYLQEARMWGANLQEAELWRANLQKAELVGANLQQANLAFANLQGANLRATNMEGTNLAEAVFDETTILPDGDTRVDHNSDLTYTPESYYQPGVTDMARYTDPNHPDFWQPEWVKKNSNDSR